MFTVDDIETDDLNELDDNLTGEGLPQGLPHATQVLVLGILAVLLPFIGFFFGIAALILHRRNKDVYVFDRAKYGNAFCRSQLGSGFGIAGMALAFISVIAYYLFRVWLGVWIILWLFGLFQN
jgi:hypothetical protein